MHFNSAHEVCNKYFRGIIGYNGNSFHDLDIGFQTNDYINLNSNRIAQVAIPFGNKTLFGGNFQTVGSNTLYAQSAALWDGTKWDTLTNKPFKYSPNKNITISSFLLDSGKLWIAGAFDTIGGVKVQNICTYDGNTYTPISVPTASNLGIKQIIRYKNAVYMCGLIFNEPKDNYSKILKRNDNGIWDSVGRGIRGGFGGIQNMLVYNDTLYLAGSFSKADGNVGNHIMKYDGNKLYDAGFGNFYDWGAVYKLIKYKNRLYAFGNFTHLANQTTCGAAYYEKGKWTVCKDSISNWGIIGAEILNDELYVAGGFYEINGDTSLKWFVKLKCPDFNNCNPKPSPNNNVGIYPNPFSNQLTINTSTTDPNTLKKIVLTNMLGQVVYKAEFYENNLTLDLPQLLGGAYVAELYLNNQFNFRTKLIKH